MRLFLWLVGQQIILTNSEVSAAYGRVGRVSSLSRGAIIDISCVAGLSGDGWVMDPIGA